MTTISAVHPGESDHAIATRVLLNSILEGKTEVANRATLGSEIPIHLFQVFRLAGFGSILEQLVGTGLPPIHYMGGQKLGQTLGDVILPKSGKDIKEYLRLARELCAKLKIGLVVLEKPDRNNRLTLRVDECVTCAGISGVKAPICHFETGMVGGLVRTFVSAERPRNVKAIERKCNAVGDGTCSIEVEVLS